MSAEANKDGKNSEVSHLIESMFDGIYNKQNRPTDCQESVDQTRRKMSMGSEGEETHKSQDVCANVIEAKLKKVRTTSNNMDALCFTPEEIDFIYDSLLKPNEQIDTKRAFNISQVGAESASESTAKEATDISSEPTNSVLGGITREKVEESVNASKSGPSEDSGDFSESTVVSEDGVTDGDVVKFLSSGDKDEMEKISLRTVFMYWLILLKAEQFEKILRTAFEEHCVNLKTICAEEISHRKMNSAIIANQYDELTMLTLRIGEELVKKLFRRQGFLLNELMQDFKVQTSVVLENRRKMAKKIKESLLKPGTNGDCAEISTPYYAMFAVLLFLILFVLYQIRLLPSNF